MDEISHKIIDIEGQIRKLHDERSVLVKEILVITREKYPVVYIIRNLQEKPKKNCPSLTPIVDTSHGCFSTYAYAEDFMKIYEDNYTGTIYADASQNVPDVRIYNMNKPFIF